jgi:hypothetical protein
MRGFHDIRLVVLAAVFGASATALADSNDVVLNRLAECQYVTGGVTTVAPSPCNVAPPGSSLFVVPDTDAFEALARDLGLVMSPKGMTTGETIGQAGFEYAYELSFNLIDSDADHWQRAIEDRDPSGLMMVSQFHVTKGLPYSFEVGAILSHLHGSELWGLGGEISFSFHEDFFWPAPDLGIRVFVNNMVGSTDMNLTIGGFDVLLDFTMGLSNVVNFTPYVGYNFTRIWASSRLLDSTPQDPSPPIEGSGGAPSNKPEFVFDNIANNFDRLLVGSRFRYAALNVTIEGAIGHVNTFSLHIGMDF